MKKTTLVFVLVCTMVQLRAQELKIKLVSSYNAFSEAIKTKDADKLKNTLSSFSYMNMKNQLLSAGMKFPDDFFAGGSEMLTDISKLTYIKTLNNGPTASIIYTGKDKYGEQVLYILKFLEENKVWKFNVSDEESSDELTKKLKA